MTRVWLARHGETDWTREGRFQGQADLPLNAIGLKQARRLAALLAEADLQALYCSDLQRALQTASIIGARLGLAPIQDCRLREMRLGEWEGMLKEQIIAVDPQLWERRELDPLHVKPPGGENLLELAERVWPAADQIARQYPGRQVLLVAHGVSLACLICRARSLPLERAFQMIPDNAHPDQVEWH